MSGLKSPPKVKSTTAPISACADTFVVHHPDSPSVVVSAAKIFPGGAAISNTWWIVFIAHSSVGTGFAAGQPAGRLGELAESHRQQGPGRAQPCGPTGCRADPERVRRLPVPAAPARLGRR